MFLTDKALVLRTVKYTDTSQIATLYTESHGQISFLVHDSRSRRATGGIRLYQPLALLEIQWDFRAGQGMQHLKEAHLLLVPQDTPYNPTKTVIALFLAEFLSHALHEEAENGELFAYLEHSIRWLDNCRESYANFHLVFILKISRFIGILPNSEAYYAGACFDLERACFTSVPQTMPTGLNADDARCLYELMLTNYEKMDSIPLSRTDRQRMLSFLNNYFSFHLAGFPPLKSMDVLQEFFNY